MIYYISDLVEDILIDFLYTISFSSSSPSLTRQLRECSGLLKNFTPKHVPCSCSQFLSTMVQRSSYPSSVHIRLGFPLHLKVSWSKRFLKALTLYIEFWSEFFVNRIVSVMCVRLRYFGISLLFFYKVEKLTPFSHLLRQAGVFWAHSNPGPQRQGFLQWKHEKINYLS